MTIAYASILVRLHLLFLAEHDFIINKNNEIVSCPMGQACQKNKVHHKKEEGIRNIPPPGSILKSAGSVCTVKTVRSNMVKGNPG